MGSLITNEGGWSSNHGLTLKGLGGRGLMFEFRNGKYLQNNSILSDFDRAGCTIMTHLDPLFPQAWAQ